MQCANLSVLWEKKGKEKKGKEKKEKKKED